MRSFRFTSLSRHTLFLVGFALLLNACGPRGLENGQMNSFGGANRGQEDKLLNRLFRDSPAGQPPPPFNPEPTTKPQKEKNPTRQPEPRQNPPRPEPEEPQQPEPRPEPQRPRRPEPQGPVTKDKQPAPPAAPAQIRGYWDEKVADGRKWTGFAVQALNNFGGELLKTVPEDIGNYCPRYAKLNRTERIDFWVKMISAIAAVESGYRPSTSYKEKMNDRNGNRVVSRGLLQISLESSRLYGCATNNDGDLVSPKRNIECGVKILSRWVPRDDVISRSANDRWYGAARYWSTLRPPKRSEKTIRALLKSNPRCR